MATNEIIVVGYVFFLILLGLTILIGYIIITIYNRKCESLIDAKHNKDFYRSLKSDQEVSHLLFYINYLDKQRRKLNDKLLARKFELMKEWEKDERLRKLTLP